MENFNYRPCSYNEQVVGMLYVPDQEWKKVYQLEIGFYQGTIFAELDKPWLGGKACEQS